MLPVEDRAVTNSISSASSISWVMGPSCTMARDSDLISISSSSDHTALPKSGPSASSSAAAFSSPDSRRWLALLPTTRDLLGISAFKGTGGPFG